MNQDINDKSPMFLPLVNGYQLNQQVVRLYQLQDQIGSGGYGFVMSAIHRETQKSVAVKFIYKHKLPAQFNGPDDIPSEVSILKQIKHPTVIEYIDSYQDEMYHYLIMELYGCEWPSSHQASDDSNSEDSSCESDTFSVTPPSLCQDYPMRRRNSSDLFECIESHTKLSESQTQNIIRQLVQCMSDLSDLGIYHRDIKDENIVVDSNFQVKLVDFGSAIQIPSDLPDRDQFTMNKFHGTITFASPEILLGLNYKPEPAEVWSLGILLFTLLYGQVPFANSTQVISGNWRRPAKEPNCSHSCLDLLDGMLKNNPQKRLSIKSILHHPWLQVKCEQPA
ncbi:Tubulin beta chain (Beta tubulin) [Mucor velutinosus]|uniref:Tubulin beta chain (Beta tubulin) n=1 Tax=Mucor velutinosus TaxID=708070 RepID=A0AAN7HVP2_9FUNG|nr:Tubulin beta chain (Beta tubulin) [Mucor velutinosus]